MSWRHFAARASLCLSPLLMGEIIGLTGWALAGFGLLAIALALAAAELGAHEAEARIRKQRDGREK